MAQKLSNLPLGAKIKLGKHQIKSETAQPIIWRIVDKNHNGYPANSVTLITDSIIDLRCFDSETDIEHAGDYDYARSNIRQWLNSSAKAGEWYSAQYAEDKAPTNNLHYGTGYASQPGFLFNFSSAERNALLPTTLTRQLFNDISVQVTDKIFLPSMWEIVGSHAVADGSSRFSHFVGNSVTATVTSQVVSYTNCENPPSSTTANWSYWTRSTNSNFMCTIGTDGNNSYVKPYMGYVGVRPCANISANTKITDTVDSDGCYTFLAQNAPTIDGSNTDLGTKYIGFEKTYTVSDVDNEPVTVTEYIDSVKIRSYEATLGETRTFAVTDTTWLKLANGIHTMKIVATDGFDEVVRTFTFTKSVTTLVAQRSTAIESTAQPKSIIVTVVKNIPNTAIFKVEACNNGFDTSPKWEDITSRVLQGRIHDFTNTTKTAAKWGVNVRVTVDRNGAEGACYITEIGGNFE